MNRTFVVGISIATVLLLGLLIALSIIRPNVQSPEQASTAQIVIPTSVPNSQPLRPTPNTIESNSDVQLSSADGAAIENTSKKLPIDSDSLSIEYSVLLDTFYIQNTATNSGQIRQFIEENNLSNLYRTEPKFFKFTDQDPGDVLDDDEYTFASENGLGEAVPNEASTPNTDIQKQMSVLKGLLGIALDYSTPTPKPSIQPNIPSQVSPQSLPSTRGSVNMEDCNKIVGNERIICAALKFTGIRYGFIYNHKESLRRWGVLPQGTVGRPPAEWIATRTPEGPTDFLVCSSYTDLAIYVAFGFYKKHLSHSYLNDKENFREVPVNSTLPGDLVIKGTAAAGDGHVAILVTRYPNGSMKTLESTSARSGRSGYFNRKPGSFTRAVRYIGPGSTP